MKRILTAAVLGAFTLVTTGLGEAEMFVYPKNSQTKEQQEQDEDFLHVGKVSDDHTGARGHAKGE